MYSRPDAQLTELLHSSAPSDLGANATSSPAGAATEILGTSTSVSTTTSKTETPTSTAPSVAGAVSPAPTDEGCPNINGTAYTPVDASGKAIQLDAGGAAQSFLRYCDTNWPAGSDYGNPGIHDIMKMYLPSLEDCITACASYNQNYRANLDRGIGDSGSGLCRAVSIVKACKSQRPELRLLVELQRVVRGELTDSVA